MITWADPRQFTQKNIHVYLDIHWADASNQNAENPENGTNGMVDYVLLMALLDETQDNYAKFDTVG